jgi:hypothetical protein
MMFLLKILRFADVRTPGCELGSPNHFLNVIEFEDRPEAGQAMDANENMNKPTALRTIGEGVLIFHATAVLPIWSELTLPTDSSYPLARNIVLQIMFWSVPYSVWLLLSHPLYRKTQTNAPLISWLLSLAMFTGTVYLWSVINRLGEKGIIVLFLAALQNLLGMVLFGVLRYRYRNRIMQ